MDYVTLISDTTKNLLECHISIIELYYDSHINSDIESNFLLYVCFQY